MDRQHHYLKCETEYYQAIERGKKKFELRKNDRNFKVGDMVHLQKVVDEQFTGRVMLTAGVDVQDNRLAVVIRAWGRGEESWLVYWNEIYGDPAQPQVWADLDALLSRPFDHAAGQQLHVLCAAIDSGGHHTNAVYAFARRNPRYIAIKGMSQPGKPIIGHPSTVDLTWQGERIANGCQLWPIGSDTAKATIYSRLKITQPGPGYYHFPIGVEDAYFIQLTAEKLITKYVKGFPRMEWVLVGKNNEALDCEVYCYAAAIRAGIVHLNWQQLEDAIWGAQIETAAPAPARRVQNPRAQNRWADRW